MGVDNLIYAVYIYSVISNPVMFSQRKWLIKFYTCTGLLCSP